MYNIYRTLQQLFPKTGTSSKPTKIYGNYSKKFNNNLTTTPVTAFKRNLKQIIGGARIEIGEVKKFSFPSRRGKCTPCLSSARTLCCNQVLTTNTFMSQQAKQTFNIFFNHTCKMEYVIYLMKRILYKMQYVGKAETAFNLRLNNYRKDT